MLVKRALPLICLAALVVCGLGFSAAAPGVKESSEGYCQVKWNSRVLEAKSLVSRT